MEEEKKYEKKILLSHYMPVVRCGAFGTILGTICEEATRCARLRIFIRSLCTGTTKRITFHLLNFDLEISSTTSERFDLEGLGALQAATKVGLCTLAMQASGSKRGTCFAAKGKKMIMPPLIQKTFILIEKCVVNLASWQALWDECARTRGSWRRVLQEHPPRKSLYTPPTFPPS